MATGSKRRGSSCWLLAAITWLAATSVVLAQAPSTDDDASTQARPAAPVDPAMLPTEPAPLADASLLLDIAAGEQRAIAVGERGHVLVSESREDWRQVADVPTRSTLTGIATAGSHAWVVGHDQVVLHSADDGLHWERQHLAPYEPGNWDDITNGAPLLDVLFLDDQRGFAIGAYGLMLATSDGGTHWERGSINDRLQDDEAAMADGGADADAGLDDAGEGADDWTFSDEDLLLEELTDPHLNAIARTGSGALFIAAERGSAYRSRDEGESWERISIPYDGSMFGVLGFDGEHVLVFGLRGNAFESHDLGSTWTALDTGTEQTLQGGTVVAGGGVVLVGSGGVVLVRQGAGDPFQQFLHDEGGALADVLPLAGRDMVLVGERGIARFTTD